MRSVRVVPWQCLTPAASSSFYEDLPRFPRLEGCPFIESMSVPLHIEALSKAERGVGTPPPGATFLQSVTFKVDGEETAAVWKEARFKCPVALASSGKCLEISIFPFFSAPSPPRRGKRAF